MRIKPAFVVTIISLFLSVNVSGQQSFMRTKSKRLAQFMKSKTLVVLDSNEAYNTAIRESITSLWKVTPYDFISREEFNKLKKDPQYSFIVLMAPQISHDMMATSYKTRKQHQLMACIVGGPDVERPINLDEYVDYIAYALLDQFGVEPVRNDCAWRMPFLISSMQNAIEVIAAGEEIDYELNTYLMENKTLYILKENLRDHMYSKPFKGGGKPLKENEIKNFYHYDYKIVSKAEVTDALKNKTEGVCILFHVSNYDDGWVHDYIYDTMTQQVVYADDRNPRQNYLTQDNMKFINYNVTTQIGKHKRK